LPSELRKHYELVVPAWNAGTQVHMDVSGCILRAWMPAIHAGMTEAADGQKLRRTVAVAWWEIPPFSSSVGERKLMNHFVVRPNPLNSTI
jgi:hypothetical protein